MIKIRRGYNYNKDYGSRRDILNSMKRLKRVFKFPKKRRHKRNKLFIFHNNMRNFYPVIGKIGSMWMHLDLAEDSDEEESDN